MHKPTAHQPQLRIHTRSVLGETNMIDPICAIRTPSRGLQKLLYFSCVSLVALDRTLYPGNSCRHPKKLITSLAITLWRTAKVVSTAVSVETTCKTTLNCKIENTKLNVNGLVQMGKTLVKGLFSAAQRKRTLI